VTIHPEDRALWGRYVRLRRGAAGAGDDRTSGDGPISGEDAAAVAAYLELRLDEWERAAFERRLVDEPLLLETLIAARRARDEAAPQALSAFALNLAPAAPVCAPAPAARRRRWLLPFPAMAWSLATLAFLGAFGLGAYLTWQFVEPPVTAQKRKDPSDDPLRPRNNSVFEDPARTTFDGMDVDKK
jgi:hypothetical protein